MTERSIAATASFAIALLIATGAAHAQAPAGGAVPRKGDPCVSKAELETAPGTYFTSAQYPWPAVRAEYFAKMATAADKANAKQTLERVEDLERQTRRDFALAGGSWEAYFSSDGYEYAGSRKLADYRFQVAFHEHLCIREQMQRNGEFSTVLRVHVNTLPINVLSKFVRRFPGTTGTAYDYKDMKAYKPGVTAPLIDLFTYLEIDKPELVTAINSGTSSWQDVPEREVRKDSYDHVYRYWFVKRGDAPILLPVTRKEYLESLLEFYDREAQRLPKASSSMSLEAARNYYGDIPTVIANKKALVEKALKENTAEWLSRQAVVNGREDLYLTQKQKLPEYSSSLTFHRFYDGDKGGSPLYKYNPAYFSTAQSPASPEFLSVVFRYVHKPAPLRLVDNFTTHFDVDAWKNVLAPSGR